MLLTIAATLCFLLAATAAVAVVTEFRTTH